MNGKADRRAGRNPSRILIVDDHPITRHGLSQLLNQEPDLTVCGEMDNAQTALASIRTRQPNLVLADITMAGKSGLELVKEMKAMHPDIPVLALSMHDENIYAERVLRAGGRGYLMKSAGGAELLKAVRHVLQGEVYVSRQMSAKLLDLFSGKRFGAGASSLGSLTDREFEVFQLLGQGLSAHEIGKRLHISSKTVDTHRLHIKDKLRLRTMPELMSHAVRWSATQNLI